MEHVGELISEGVWNNISHEIYSSSPDEEANFMAQVLDNSSLPCDQYWPVIQEATKTNETSIYSSSSDEYNYFDSQGNTNGFTSGSFLFTHFYASHQVSEAKNGSISMDYYCVDEESKNPENDILMETNGDDFLLINQDLSIDGSTEFHEINNDNHHQITDGLHGINLHRGRVQDNMLIPMNKDQSHSSDDEKVSSPSSDIAKKRPPVSPVDIFPKNKRTLKQKNQNLSSSTDGHKEEDDAEKINNTMLKGQNSMMNCWSTDEDDSVASSRSSSKRLGGITNRNGKQRANRGSATDPQSLYARKRRERINERLKILQNLVPNGTKVDISTMLEEAVQYVNFLQLQIKLLSSDDLWMYAPIAYNGMDIGLDLKIDAARSNTK